MCRPSVAPLAWEKGSHDKKSGSWGVEKELWRPPGASWAAGEAQEGALGGQGGIVVALVFFWKGPNKFFFGVFRPPEDVFVFLGADFGSVSPPGGGGPGRAHKVPPLFRGDRGLKRKEVLREKRVTHPEAESNPSGWVNELLP